jgi:hypothetical protein
MLSVYGLRKENLIRPANDPPFQLQKVKSFFDQCQASNLAPASGRTLALGLEFLSMQYGCALENSAMHRP